MRPIAFVAFKEPVLRELLGRCEQIPRFSNMMLDDWMTILGSGDGMTARYMLDAITSIRA